MPSSFLQIQDWYDTHSYGADLQFLQAMVWSQVEDNQVTAHTLLTTISDHEAAC